MQPQGGRHADEDGIGLTQAAEVGRRLEMAAVPQRGHPLRGDMADVALPGLEPFHLGGIHIEAQDREALAGKELDKW